MSELRQEIKIGHFIPYVVQNLFETYSVVQNNVAPPSRLILAAVAPLDRHSRRRARLTESADRLPEFGSCFPRVSSSNCPTPPGRRCCVLSSAFPRSALWPPSQFKLGPAYKRERRGSGSPRDCIESGRSALSSLGLILLTRKNTVTRPSLYWMSIDDMVQERIFLRTQIVKFFSN